MSKYGEATIVELIVNKLPDVMKEIASPLDPKADIIDVENTNVNN